MFILIDKPKDITSHDVVDQIRKITQQKRVGHAGTLDPNATGLLIVGVGREYTKKLGEISKDTQKEYVAEIFLGEERDTDDTEGKVLKKSELIPDKKAVSAVVSQFEGEQEQIPPVFSAIKLQGRKSYDLARAGKAIALDSRKVTVFETEILAYDYPLLQVRFLVSSGTYIRALARDIGHALGTYAYLKDLRRTKIGNYSIENAHILAELTQDNWQVKGIK